MRNLSLLVIILLALQSPKLLAKKIQTHVGKAKSAASLTALAPINHTLKGKANMRRVQSFEQRLKRALEVSGLFHFLSPNAFVEDTHRVSIYPKAKDPNFGFNFQAWKSLSANFLIRSQISPKRGGQVHWVAILYHVPSETSWVTYKADIQLKDTSWAINRFSDAVYKKLTGKKSFYNSKIVAVAKPPRSKRKNVYIMDWDGGNKQRITNAATPHFSPTWSSDGRYIAYSGYYWHKREQKINLDIFVYDRKRKQTKLFSYRKGANSSPSFFPNSSAIMASLGLNGRMQLFKLPFNSRRRPTRFTTTITPSIESDISPNGKQVVYTGGARPTIYLLDTRSGKNKRLTKAGKYNASPKWSPNADLIAFAGQPDSAHNFDIYTISPNGLNLKRITKINKTSGGRASNEHPSFSPDGRLILFTSNRTGTKQLHITNRAASRVDQITFDGYEYYMPEWSPQ